MPMLLSPLPNSNSLTTIFMRLATLVAGGSGARGKVDWNSLVAAGGKKQAKKLGLLNSDEENSSDEESEEEDEEDEMALLDKMLKERHGMTKRDHQLAAELASDSEEESESEGEDEGVLEKEEKEQERLAKRIAKRAKMQRLLAEYGDSQSQSMLLDEVRTCEERSDELGIRQLRSKFSCASSSSLGIDATIIVTQF